MIQVVRQHADISAMNYLKDWGTTAGRSEIREKILGTVIAPPVPVVLFRLSSSEFPVPLSCPPWPVLLCCHPRLSCPGRPVPSWLPWIDYPGCPVQDFLSRLSCPHFFRFLLMTILSQLYFLAIAVLFLLTWPLLSWLCSRSYSCCII